MPYGAPAASTAGTDGDSAQMQVNTGTVEHPAVMPVVMPVQR